MNDIPQEWTEKVASVLFRVIHGYDGYADEKPTVRNAIDTHARTILADVRRAVAGPFLAAAELTVQDVRAQCGDRIASLVEESFAAHFARARKLACLGEDA